MAQGHAGPWKAAALLAAILIATAAGALAYRGRPTRGAPLPGAVEPAKAPAERGPAGTPAAPKEEQTGTGRVVGADGKPVPGVSVVVVGTPLCATAPTRPPPSVPRPEGKADDEGRFRLTMPHLLGAVRRRPPDRRRGEARPAWRRLNPDADSWDAELKLPPEQVIRGSLVDLQGQPAAGVKVTPSYLGGMTNGQPDGFSLAALRSAALARGGDNRRQGAIRGPRL